MRRSSGIAIRRCSGLTRLSIEGGVEHTIPYSKVSLDTDDFYNQRVLIIGKGNSAFEMADHLGYRLKLLGIAKALTGEDGVERIDARVHPNDGAVVEVVSSVIALLAGLNEHVPSQVSHQTFQLTLNYLIR